ncbi:hypothetical protein J467_4012, partial [Acinetobacter baumannii 916567]
MKADFFFHICNPLKVRFRRSISKNYCFNLIFLSSSKPLAFSFASLPKISSELDLTSSEVRELLKV